MYTSYQSNQLFEVAWRKIETQLQSKLCDYIPVDGAAPENKEIRSALWAISGKRTYPQVRRCSPLRPGPPSTSAPCSPRSALRMPAPHQVFIYGDTCAYIGDGDEVQELFDSGGASSVFSEYLGKKNWEPGTPRGEM